MRKIIERDKSQDFSLIVSTGRYNCVQSVHKRRPSKCATHLGEPDGGGLLTEALTAEVEAVLADETSLVSTVAAEKDNHFVSFPMSLEHAEGGRYSPLAGALTELAGAREPDGVVCHFGILEKLFDGYSVVQHAILHR